MKGVDLCSKSKELVIAMHTIVTPLVSSDPGIVITAVALSSVIILFSVYIPIASNSLVVSVIPSTSTDQDIILISLLLDPQYNVDTPP